jgi:hypothetical protein
MTTVTNIEMPWLALVRQADPGYDRARRHELAYEATSFGGCRKFFLNPLTSGAYNVPDAPVGPSPGIGNFSIGVSSIG